MSQVGKKEVRFGDIKDGAYSVTGVPIGPVQVKVETFKPIDPDKMPKDTPKPKGSPEPRGGGGKYVEIPRRYGDFKQSGLTYEVTGGSQTKDFNLKP
jgi:hypothetical protein